MPAQHLYRTTPVPQRAVHHRLLIMPLYFNHVPPVMTRVSCADLYRRRIWMQYSSKTYGDSLEAYGPDLDSGWTFTNVTVLGPRPNRMAFQGAINQGVAPTEVRGGAETAGEKNHANCLGCGMAAAGAVTPNLPAPNSVQSNPTNPSLTICQPFGPFVCRCAR